MRELSHRFMTDLLEGELRQLLATVKTDDTLDLAIRDNLVEVYYRGGVLLRVEANRYTYRAEFDDSHTTNRHKSDHGSPAIDKLKTIEDHIKHIPLLKKEMNQWLFENPEKVRGYEQAILRENNWGSASEETDYFIVDWDYVNPHENTRFDMLAVKWPCLDKERNACKIPTFSILDLKYGDRDLTGYNGFEKRFSDLEGFVRDEQHRVLALEVETLFNQRMEMGMFRNVNHKLEIDSSGKLEYLILFINHKPLDTRLLEALDEACKNHEELLDMADIKVATGSCLGYGLFEWNMIPVRDFLGERLNRLGVK
ncbi:hypothetical protein J0B03_03295 [Alkalibacter rhizosphaerae]|uniref:Uncharacterized protein n=1 Tax=Alkalibacter rhizosphaerae TaxID=2815577 RepID=A0A974XIQ7_9FIRM|nr:hypothetical protein [Alkalibacter rhizosphaerae]QSX09108.1 hypothetical protein J0B03_03295 [Alkalibacter rhizosphaerae]